MTSWMSRSFDFCAITSLYLQRERTPLNVTTMATASGGLSCDVKGVSSPLPRQLLRPKVPVQANETGLVCFSMCSVHSGTPPTFEPCQSFRPCLWERQCRCVGLLLSAPLWLYHSNLLCLPRSTPTTHRNSGSCTRR